jgi:Aldehyde dehydrogenase family
LDRRSIDDLNDRPMRGWRQALGSSGGELTSNRIVRKLTLTGSTEVGKLLMEQRAGTVKKLSLELGGNARRLSSATTPISRWRSRACPDEGIISTRIAPLGAMV